MSQGQCRRAAQPAPLPEARACVRPGLTSVVHHNLGAARVLRTKGDILGVRRARRAIAA